MDIFNPYDPDFLQNPYPTYDRLLTENPVFYHAGTKLWFFTRHKDVDAILRDRRFGRSILHLLSREELDWPPENPAYEPFNKLGRHSMFGMEPPEHTRLHGLVHKAFTPARIRSMHASIQELTTALLDEAEVLCPAQGHFDLLHDFAAPLAVNVISRLLGVPDADLDKLRPWSNAIVKLYELNHTPEQAAAAIQSSQEFADYLKDLARQRRESPQNDLITALVQVEQAGDRLTEDELVSTCVLLLNAGHEATVNALGNGWRALFQHPAQLALLRANANNPTLIASAVEEILRYDTPVQLFRRWVLEDLTYAGVEFKQGTEIGLMFGAANHDPLAFANPHDLEITRSPNPHIAFGGGVHFCLGAPLARMELQVTYQALLARFPNLHPAADSKFIPAYVIRGLEGLALGI